MNLDVHKKTIDLGDGRPVTIETGKLAKQAHGSVVVRMGDTMLLATAVANYEAKEGRTFGLKKASLCFGLEDENIQYEK